MNRSLKVSTPFAAAHRVQQVVVQIIDLQFGHRPAVHGQRIFAREIREIGHLRGDEHLLARMAFEGRCPWIFGKALHVDGRRIEIVDPVGNGIIDQLVDGLLVDRIPVGRRRVSSNGQRMQPYPSSDTRSPVAGVVRKVIRSVGTSPTAAAAPEPRFPQP